MLDTALGVVQVVVGFSALIFVHELGHFLVAKWAGVRVEVFSIGFGPYLLSHKRGHTLYALSVFPLGGYVKMRGQHDLQIVDDQAPDSYLAQSIPRRMAIIVAGVVMNVVFAHTILVLAYAGPGIYFRPSVIEEPREGTPGAKAKLVDGDTVLESDRGHGLKDGDRIVAVNGSKVTRFHEIIQRVAYSDPQEPVKLLVRRGGADGRTRDLTFEVLPEEDAELHLLMLKVRVDQVTRHYPIGCRTRSWGEINEGVLLLSIQKKSPAEAAGLKAWDIVRTLNGKPMPDFKTFRQSVRSAKATEIEIEVLRGGSLRTCSLTPRKAPGGNHYQIGVVSGNGFQVVDTIAAGSPAAKAGLKKGELIFHVKAPPLGRPVQSVVLTTRRFGEKDTRKLTVPVEEGWLSLSFDADFQEHRRYGLLPSFVEAGREIGRLLADTFYVLYGLLSRRIGLGALSGPVGIARATFLSTEPGLGYYLWFLALISANLAVINLLPIPVLDGGHIVFLTLEAVRRKPVSQRVLEYAQIAGLLLLLALILLVTRNDIFRWLE